MKNKEEGRPEADTRRLVEKFLLLLGHSEKQIVFEVGRIDVRVNDTTEQPWAVCEVKRSLADRKMLDDARRKGFDYAGQVGAPLVVLTDGDRYEIYDRTKGTKYETQLCGKFQLTRYKKKDERLIDMLRPKAGR